MEGKTQFFQQLPATDFQTNNASFRSFQRKLDLIEAPDSMLDCCLMSYRVQEANGETQVRYQIFGTTLITH